MVIIFCGLFCSGKSTVGTLCAKKLGLPFYDTDRMIEAHYGGQTAVGDIWKKLGNETFRDLESEMVCSLKFEPAVLATGGGTLLREKNRNHLNKIGSSIYLKASVLKLFSRMMQRGLPAHIDPKYPFKHLKKIAEQRFPIYEKHCQYMMDAEEAEPAELAERLWVAIVSGKFSASPHGASPMAKPLEL